MESLKKFCKDESGLEMIEYSVLAALVVCGLVALFPPLRLAIVTIFTAITNTLNAAITG